MRVKFTPRALRDLERICHYIATDSPAAATRVSAAIWTLAGMLSEQPDVGRRTSRDGVRSIPTPRLPYIVFYRPLDGEIEILNVRDGRRRPLP